MTRRATEVNLIRQNIDAATVILGGIGNNETSTRLRKAEIYAKLALAAAVERLTAINLDLGNVKVDLDLIPEQRVKPVEDT